MVEEGARRLLENPVTFAELGVHVHVKRVVATSEERPMFVSVFEHIDFISGLVVKWGVGIT